jgi:hypothetical protein
MSEYVVIEEATLVRATDKSLLLDVGGHNFWVRKSLVNGSESDSFENLGDSGVIALAKSVCEIEGVEWDYYLNER